MIAYRDNDSTDPRHADAWRAQFLSLQAQRLEMQAEKLRKQAQEYRDLASRLNPTSSLPST